jgi:hypothetical protein
MSRTPSCCKRALAVVILLSCVWYLEGDIVPDASADEGINIPLVTGLIDSDSTLTEVQAIALK